MCPSTSPVRVFVCTPEPRLYAAYDRAATFSSAKKYKTSDDRYDHPSDISIEFNIISSSRTERGMFISISHASGSYIGLQLHARESVNRRPFSHAWKPTLPIAAINWESCDVNCDNVHRVQGKIPRLGQHNMSVSREPVGCLKSNYKYGAFMLEIYQ